MSGSRKSQRQTIEVEALREDPSPIEALTVPAIIEHYEGIEVELVELLKC